MWLLLKTFKGTASKRWAEGREDWAQELVLSSDPIGPLDFETRYNWQKSLFILIEKKEELKNDML